MKKEEFGAKIDSLLEKIGTDSSNLILDDIGILLTDNDNMNKELENKSKEIEDLKKRNETLQRVNGNLLQQVSVQTEEDVIPKKENAVADRGRPDFDMRSIFDSNGNFKNKM